MQLEDFFRFLFKMGLSRSHMVRDMSYLRSENSDNKTLLVPFTKDEMELLSLNQVKKTKKRGFNKLTKGIFNTIYYEALVAYAILEYYDDNKLILITTSKDEFIYMVKKGSTHVYMNNIEAGVINDAGEFFSVNRKLLAKIDGADHLATHAVWIQGKNIGFIANPKHTEKTLPRAYNLLKDMTQDEQNIFLCLTLINLVEESQ